MEAAADLVVDAAGRHAPAGEVDRVEQVRAAGRGATAGAGAGRPVCAGTWARRRARRRPGRRGGGGPRPPAAAGSDRAPHRRRGRLLQPLHAGQELRRRPWRRPPAARGRPARRRRARAGSPACRGGRRGEIGAAVEGLAVRGEEDRQRPAAAPGQQLHGLHVDVVDVGALLAVDLHVDEAARSSGAAMSGVLERLALHHVAPVAGRVADREQDRLVLGAGPRERLVAPRVPVDRIVRVLQEVGLVSRGEPVGRCGACAPSPRRSQLCSTAIGSPTAERPSGCTMRTFADFRRFRCENFATCCLTTCRSRSNKRRRDKNIYA